MIILSTASVYAQIELEDCFDKHNTSFDIIDKIGDDKGTGYYQYPSDNRLRRGTFDIKRFTVYEEKDIVVFEIQMRNYILRVWPDSRESEDQGFVANLWDIYIDVDGLDNSGYKRALPGRDLLFSDNKRWEKVIMISPLAENVVSEILREKTDELEFQDQIEDIIYPDYVDIQGNKIIIKVSKLKLPGLSCRSGFQCLSMGFKDIVSPNRLLNRDVRAFATKDDFGGGEDIHGDPPVMDIITPKGGNQYKLLRDFRTDTYRENIRYASVPFVYASGNNQPPSTTILNVTPQVVTGKKQNSLNKTVNANSELMGNPPIIKGSNGFVPLKSSKPPVAGVDSNFLPKAPDGFIPVKKRK